MRKRRGAAGLRGKSRKHAQPGIQIQIQATVHLKPNELKLLEQIAQQVCAAEAFSDGSLSIAIVGAAAMSRLHLAHSGIPGPTDVLTFDLGCDRRRGTVDAEIVVCRDVARRRNPSRPVNELALYVTHGILHLAGHDDHTPRGFARMHAREDELLTRLGLGPVFSREN